MTSPATLSLLIPAYNAADHLPRLLKSAQAQTHQFDQIWVYDDCSTDDTADVARRYGANVIQGDVNKGCSAGKNALARHVATDWMHFHDADDALMPNFVQLARKWIARDQLDVVLFDYEWRDEATNELLLIRRFDQRALSLDARSYAIREQINPFCGLYRRSAYLRAGGYDEDPCVLYNEDVAFHIRLAFAGLKFGAELATSIVNYRREGSMSAGSRLKCAQAHYHVMRKSLQLAGADAYGKEIGAKLWAVAGQLASFKDWRHADDAVELAARLVAPPRQAGSAWFRAMARLAPRAALRTRETAIRAFRPNLRAT